MASHRRLGAAVATLAAVTLIAGPVSAVQWSVFSESGTSAFAEGDFTCIDNGDGTTTCSGTILDVFAGKTKEDRGFSTAHTERVCWNQFTSTTAPGEFIESAGVFGCAIDAGTLSIDNLTSITLAETEISLTQFECRSDPFTCTSSPGGTVVIEGTWTGVGPITSQKSKTRFDDGTCFEVNAIRGSSRQASFSGTVDGDPFTAEGVNASMHQGTQKFRISCELL